jgi:hypothetical protein
MNEADKCVYYRCGGGEGVILCLYVDNILIFGNNINVIKEAKDFLSTNFAMKDLGEANVILTEGRKWWGNTCAIPLCEKRCFL